MTGKIKPRLVSQTGLILFRSNPATNRCSLHLSLIVAKSFNRVP